MKKLIYSALLYLCSSFALNAVEPDVSNLATFNEVLQELDSYHPTYLDLRIGKANTILSSRGANHEFSGLEEVRDGEYKINSGNLGKCNIVCEVNVGGWISNDGLIHHTIGCANEVKQMYIGVKDLAKKYINHFIDDENIIVIQQIKYREWKDGKWEVMIEPLAKWENGQVVYYEGFITHLYKNS